MNDTLTITGYAGVPFERTIAALSASGRAVIADAVGRSERRVSPGFDGTIDVDRTGINELTLRIAAETSELDGAILTVKPVGDTAAGVTELILRLGREFPTGGPAGTQFLAATTLVAALTETLAGERKAA